MTEYTKFGLEARKILILQRKSMTKLAKEIGISCTYLSEILRGTRKSEKYKEKIAQILGMPVNELTAEERKAN
ncbi:MAG: Helix-turn-helix domain protein [Pelotomaculum sp. PtaB.Bin104]|nr:MAG: Helix-turn-helix domain protein [Pelotomaculum sp. PtaB.Bin104]